MQSGRQAARESPWQAFVTRAMNSEQELGRCTVRMTGGKNGAEKYIRGNTQLGGPKKFLNYGALAGRY